MNGPRLRIRWEWTAAGHANPLGGWYWVYDGVQPLCGLMVTAVNTVARTATVQLVISAIGSAPAQTVSQAGIDYAGGVWELELAFDDHRPVKALGGWTVTGRVGPPGSTVLVGSLSPSSAQMGAGRIAWLAGGWSSIFFTDRFGYAVSGAADFWRLRSVAANPLVPPAGGFAQAVWLPPAGVGAWRMADGRAYLLRTRLFDAGGDLPGGVLWRRVARGAWAEAAAWPIDSEHNRAGAALRGEAARGGLWPLVAGVGPTLLVNGPRPRSGSTGLPWSQDLGETFSAGGVGFWANPAQQGAALQGLWAEHVEAATRARGGADSFTGRQPAPLLGIAYATRTRGGAAAEDLVVHGPDVSGLARIADVRVAGETDSRPLPHLRQGDDGVLTAGCFVHGRYRSWRQNGAAWAAAEDQAVGPAVNLAQAAWRRSRSGIEAAAGWHQPDGKVYCLFRPAPGAAWETAAVADLAVGAAVYLLDDPHRHPGAAWEIGWHDGRPPGTGDGWTRYTAPHPEGPWGVAA